MIHFPARRGTSPLLDISRRITKPAFCKKDDQSLWPFSMVPSNSVFNTASLFPLGIRKNIVYHNNIYELPDLLWITEAVAHVTPGMLRNILRHNESRMDVRQATRGGGGRTYKYLFIS
jgi:hypothetical protein